MPGRRAPRAVALHAARPRRLRTDRAEGGLGGEQVEGRRAVRELLAAGRRAVHEVVIAEGQDASTLLDEVIALARAARVPLRSASPSDLRAVARSETPQGVVARAAPVEPVELDALVTENPGRGPARTPDGAVPFIVVVAEVTDPRNLGAVLRSALGAGATGVVLARRRTTHLTPSALKAAAGAVEHLPIALVPGIGPALTALSARGVWTVGLDPEGERVLDELEIATEPLAIVVGAEGRGLAPLVKKRCDIRCRIPLYGPVESLNVSVAAAVALFAIASRRHDAGHRAG
ncbi:MAG: 23S rRNA (guanosine(2251)-2'-O)-methyltransferase RlmB [Acidimicrobiales bacterium]